MKRLMLWYSRYKMPIHVFWILVMLAFLAWSVLANWKEFCAYSWQLHVGYLFLSVGFTLVRRLLGAVRWSHVLGAFSESKLSLGENLRIYFITNLATYLPGSLWYIAGRVAMNKEKGVSAVTTSMAVLVETVLVLLTGALMGLPCLLVFVSEDSLLDWRFLVGLVVAGLVAVHPKMLRLVLGFLSQLLNRKFEDVRATYWQMLGLMAESLLIWLAGGVSMFYLVKSLYPLLSGQVAGVVVSIAALAWVTGFLTVFAPAGLGVREGMMAWLLGQYAPASVAGASALASRLVMSFEDVFWAGVTWLALLVQKNRAKSHGRCKADDIVPD
jgi:hypothetical protein